MTSVILRVTTPKARIFAALAFVRLWGLAARIGIPVPRDATAAVGWLGRWVARGVRVSATRKDHSNA